MKIKIWIFIVLVSVTGLIAYVGFDRAGSPKNTNAVQEPEKADGARKESNTSKSVVRLAVEEYAPFTGEKLRGKGLLSIVVREAFELEGIQSEITFYPGRRAYEDTRQGSSDGTYNWADREERHEHFYYSDKLMVAERELFFFRKGENFDWDPRKQDYAALAGSSLVANIGYNYGPKFQEAEKNKVITVHRVSSMKQAFDMVLAGRVKMYIHFDMVGREFVNTKLSVTQKSQIDAKLAIDGPVEYDYVLFSKKSINGKFFWQAFNKGLKKLRASGRYGQIFEKWFADAEAPSSSSE